MRHRPIHVHTTVQEASLAAEITTLSGIVRTITFRNDENGYTVMKLDADGYTRIVSATGNIASIEAGESVKLTGEWITDPKYGRQFKFESCEPVQPYSAEGIQRFLASANIKGIGPVLSERIVEKFGEQTIEVLDNHPERLRRVKGISPKLIGTIAEGWAQHRHIRDIMIFLQSYDISPAYAAKIYHRYKGETIAKLRENPYRLIADIRGIGFVKADQIAANLGIDRQAPERIRAGIIYTLDAAADAGHVYLPEPELIESSAQTLALDAGEVLDILNLMKEQGHVITEEERIYRPDLAEAEREVAMRIMTLAAAPQQAPVATPEDANALAEQVSADLGMTFADQQRQSLVSAAHTNLMVLTGGPGTGKTTTVLGIIALFKRLKRSVMLCAPTGRAAKRMTEATRREAMTVHRLLEYDPFRGGFKKNVDDPLEADVIIMDEASMVDTFLMRDFLRAVRPGTAVVIVGDVDQLPSIGPGCVLRDIIESGTVTTVRLTEIFRQAATSRIVKSAHRINHGEMPLVENSREGNFFFIRQTAPGEIATTIVDLVTRRLPDGYGFDPRTDVQVLSPMHRGETGVGSLNRLIQERLNPHNPRRPEVARGEHTFRTGDKVMQIRNNYDKMVYNGDIGWVTNIDPSGQKLQVRFEQLVEYTFNELDEIVPAYAISVHKSQGSEFRCVIMPVTTQHFIMLKRNLLYTGITRAKELVVLLGDYKALAIAVKNDQAGERYTSLAGRLRDGVQGMEHGDR